MRMDARWGLAWAVASILGGLSCSSRGGKEEPQPNGGTGGASTSGAGGRTARNGGALGSEGGASGQTSAGDASRPVAGASGDAPAAPAPQLGCGPLESVDPLGLAPTEADWEAGYQHRLSVMMNANTWPVSAGDGDGDTGKRDWPALLAEMWKLKSEPANLQNLQNLQNLIDTTGRRLVFSSGAGRFYKPFSNPGYTLYFCAYQDQIPAEQWQKATTMIDAEGWDEMTRPDHHMDPIYPMGTEFNSENFNWMARLSGVYWAHRLNRAERVAYFDGYLANWVRAIVSAGRVEWNSNSYWGYVFQPALVLHQCAPDAETKKRVRAVLDWLVVEAALHTLDGAQVGPDARAKDNAYQSFSGSIWPFTYLYFTDPAHPAITDAEAAKNMPVQQVGWAGYSSYRPPQVAIDIARRKFKTPIEIQSAKPFYALDHDNYADWRGDTDRSRRFDFETLYLDDEFTLGSVATGRPDGSVGTFSEEGIWRLGVRRGAGGPVQLMGNAGPSDASDGRSPYEEVAQYANVLLRAVRGTNRLWVGAPAGVAFERAGTTAFADLGHDVYIALVAHKSTATSDKVDPNDAAYRQWTWSFDAGTLGALALEVGTAKAHGSYAQFKSDVRTKASFAAEGDAVTYRASDGKELKLGYVAPITYTMYDGTVINPAGTIPHVWRDGKEVDFAHWSGYQVAAGDAIIAQPWGGGALDLCVGGRGLHVAVDAASARVTYAGN